MTEYDFSPEALDAYIQKQHKIANWVDHTKRQPPANPFTPATPAVHALQIKREDGDNRHRRKESRSPRDRHRDQGRDRDRAIDPADIRQQSSSPTSAKLRSNGSHSASYTTATARQDPTRGRTLPIPLQLPPQNGYIPTGKPASPTYAYYAHYHKPPSMIKYDSSRERYAKGCTAALEQSITSFVDQHANYVPPHLRSLSYARTTSALESEESRTKIKSGALSSAKQGSDTPTRNPFLKYPDSTIPNSHSQSPKTKSESQPPMSHDNTPSQSPKTPDPGTTPYSFPTRHRIERRPVNRRAPPPPPPQAQAPPQPDKNFAQYYYLPPPPTPQDLLRLFGPCPGTPNTTRPIATPTPSAFQAPASSDGRIVLPLWDHPDPPVSCGGDATWTPPVRRGSTGTSDPGVVELECADCHATLWKRGLGDGELICKLCRLHHKLHKPPRSRSADNPTQTTTPPAPPHCHTCRSSPTLASDSSSRLSYESGKDISEFRTITDSSEFIGGCGLTDTSVFITRSHSIPPLHWCSDSHPRSTKNSDTQTLITNLRRQSDVDDGGLPMLPLHHRALHFSGTPDRESPPPFPDSQPPPDNNERLSVDYDLNSRLQEHAGLQLALTAFLATVTLSVVCPDGKQDVLEVCRALSILRPFFVLVHFGAALATCGILFIPQNGRFAVSSHHLRLFWTVFFGLGLCCIIIQLTLYACTVGNLMTTLLTAVFAVFCALPGFYLIVLKWYYPKPRATALEQGGL